MARPTVDLSARSLGKSRAVRLDDALDRLGFRTSTWCQEGDVVVRMSVGEASDLARLLEGLKR